MNTNTYLITLLTAFLSLVSTAGAQELAELTANDASPKDFFGKAVTISGGVVAVGAAEDNAAGPDSGSVYVFSDPGGGFAQEAKLTPGDAFARDLFGSALDMDGDTLVVGASSDDHSNGSQNNEGSAYVFLRSGSTWSEQAKLLASDPAQEDRFGVSVSVSGDTIAVSSPFDDDMGSESGSVHVFVRSGVTWSHQAKIVAADGAAGDVFGTSVALDGETLLVSAHRDDDVETSSGSVYVFVRSGTNWTMEAKLLAGDAASGDAFGRSVSLSGDTAIIGAFQDDGVGVNSGSAYVFTRSGTTWSEVAKLVADDAAAFDDFGSSVSISGGIIVVGGSGDRDAGTSSGAAYVFQGSGASWSQVSKLTATEAARADFFGSSVAVTNGLAVVGSGWDDDNGRNSGSAHLFAVPIGELDPVCIPNDNSSGQPARITLEGPALAGSPLLATCTQGPPTNFGYFITGPNPGLYITPPGSMGIICIAATQYRYTGQVFQFDASGVSQASGGGGPVVLPTDGSFAPVPAVLVGESRAFQSWYRDTPSNNFSESRIVTFE